MVYDLLLSEGNVVLTRQQCGYGTKPYDLCLYLFIAMPSPCLIKERDYFHNAQVGQRANSLLV